MEVRMSNSPMGHPKHVLLPHWGFLSHSVSLRSSPFSRRFFFLWTAAALHSEDGERWRNRLGVRGGRRPVLRQRKEVQVQSTDVILPKHPQV